MSLPAYAMNSSSFPEMYERHLVGPLFRPFAQKTLDRIDLRGRRGVLDVACGTGVVARLAKQSLGDTAKVVGIDVSAPMLEVAGRIAPDVEWRVGSAEELPFDGPETFDAVVCHQGLQFFRDKEAAGRELRRVTAAGGVAAVAVWRSTADMPLLQELQVVAERHLGPIDDRRYGFGDPEALERLMRASGFREITMDRLDHIVRMDVGAQFVRLNSMAFVGMSDRAASLTDEQRSAVLERIVEESLRVIPADSVEGALELEMSTNLAIARA
jgi:ubiquinone/menaquinone biosynthesis C-methylase UbiE